MRVWPQAQTQTDAQIVEFYASAGGTASGQGTFPKSITPQATSPSRGVSTDANWSLPRVLRIPNHDMISKDESKNEIGRDTKLEFRLTLIGKEGRHTNSSS
jgi:hypothetical protein